MIITFSVVGTPVAKGSAKAFVVPSKNGAKPRAIVTQNNTTKERPWASAVAQAAIDACDGILPAPAMGSVRIRKMFFYFPRPKCHYRTGKNAHLLKDSAPKEHIQKPDLDKLERSVLDALTGIIYKDDCQLCRIYEDGKGKWWADKRPGLICEIEVDE